MMELSVSNCWEFHISGGQKINLLGIDPYAFAISNQIDAVEDFLDLTSFNTDQTMDKCYQQPGTFSMQSF